MKLVKILLPINQRGTTEACAACAFRLAERSAALLEVLHPCPAAADRLPYASELGPVYFEELIDVGRKQVALEKRQAEIWLGKTAQAFPKVRTGLLDIEGPIAPTVAMRAKGADLTVLPGLDGSEDAFFASARDAALFQSGRPVLVVPAGTRAVRAETVVVAWKDAAEAVRALAAAAPFLAEAKHVKLLSITEHGNDETAAMMADYLTQGGARIELVRFPLQSREVGQILLDAATAEDALLVMGAYGRWRWREQVFGGATEYVLRNTKVPVLMAH